MKEIRTKAKELMKGFCRLCPVCDGRACAGEVPGIGGAGTGGSFKNNFDALAGLKLNLRTIHGAKSPGTQVNLLGLDLDLPVLAAPVAGTSFNLSSQVSEEDYIRAYLSGCVDKGTMAGFGDAALETIFEAALAATRELDGAAIPFLKPWAEEELLAKIERVRAVGCPAVGVDIDAAGLITLALMGKPVSPKTTTEWRRIISQTDLPFIFKGVMTPEEALLAVEAGAAAIVVSNHGGRVLDHTPGTAQVLPAIAKAVQGKITILADGGVRSGGDVVKMMALGADAVMIGRPFAQAAIGGGREGMGSYLDQLKNEFIQAMVLTGCPNPSSIGPQVLFNPPGGLD